MRSRRGRKVSSSGDWSLALAGDQSRSLGEQLRDRRELQSPLLERRQNSLAPAECGEAPRFTTVVKQDDRAWPGAIGDRRIDRIRMRFHLGCVSGVDRPEDGARTALRRNGVPSRALVFPDEGHWVLKAPNSKRWHEEVFGWLKKYLN